MKEFKKYRLAVLPNLKFCRVKDIDIDQFAVCLVNTPYNCKYALAFGDGYFCMHPNREEMIQNTPKEKEKKITTTIANLFLYPLKKSSQNASAPLNMKKNYTLIEVES